MKIVTRFFILSLFAFLINSCAFHSGVMTGNAALSDANFKVVGYALGTSETIKFLGLGGVAVDAIVLEAKRNLYDNYPLKNGQALANVSVDFKHSFFPFISKVKVTVSADIIDFNEGAQASEIPKDFPLGVSYEDGKGIEINNELVYFDVNTFVRSGRVVGVKGNRVKLMVHNSSNRVVTKKKNINKLYFKKEIEGVIKSDFKVGEQVSYVEYIVMDDLNDVEVLKQGTVIGLGQKQAVIESNTEGTLEFVNYNLLNR